VDDRLERYAELAVRVGANVQEGQEVFINGLVEHAELIRALTRQSYRAGASYVDVLYFDQHVQRAMIELGPDQALGYSPEWLKARTRGFAGNAFLGTAGDPEPELLADLDGERLGRATPVELREIRQEQHTDHSVNWCGVGAPNAGWARQVLGEPDVERLWELVAFCFRLDEPDPVVAWREHLARLDARATALTELRPDALRYRGPGTDLTVGLLQSARWGSAGFTTAGGIYYVANMPTEEIFTTPDPRRAQGTLRSSLPLSLGGQLLRGLELTFEDGRIVQVEAENGADMVRSHLATIENADRLGERHLPHRLWRRAAVLLRGRAGRGDERLEHPRRLHGRRAGARGGRRPRGRLRGAAHPRRGVAARRVAGRSCWASRTRRPSPRRRAAGSSRGCATRCRSRAAR
jgi:aminopeptidase